LGQGTYSNETELVVGEWKDGKLHGQGKRTFANGEYYEGNWLNDSLEGLGSYVTNFGSYSGSFHNS